MNDAGTWLLDQLPPCQAEAVTPNHHLRGDGNMCTLERRRRQVVAAAVLAVGLVAAGSCAEDERGSEEVVIADVERVAADADAAGEAAAAIGAFGTELYGILRSQDGNLAISPYSVAAALAMTRAGAAGTTADELDEVLHAELTADLHRAFGSLDSELADRPGTFPVGDDEVELELAFANALWAQAGFSLEDAFLEVLGAQYGAGVHTVDYRSDAEGARQAINGWVSDRTRERIPELIPDGVLSDLTRLVLTNALYLHAPWALPFNEGATEQERFERLDGSSVDVSMMHLTEDLRYGTGYGWQALSLPYAGGSLAMVVCVPDEGEFDAVDGSVDADLLAEVAGAMEPRSVQLALPRWEFRTQAALSDPLVALGMATAFGDAADFSPMSTEEDLAISDVLHEVFVSVDEEGTEAAAATAVVIGATAAPPDQPVELVVDRPFLFWVIDEPTGALLFLGRVVDPSAA